MLYFLRWWLNNISNNNNKKKQQQAAATQPLISLSKSPEIQSDTKSDQKWEAKQKQIETETETETQNLKLKQIFHQIGKVHI